MEMTEEKEKLVVIIGPTAVGKTKVSVKLAKRLNGEIVNGDAMQVYKGMDVGTAKIKEEEKEGIPHHLFDVKEPTEDFSAADFQKLAIEKISEIAKNGRIPILVGGTGLYIQAVLYHYNFTENSSNPAYRQRFERMLHEQGNIALHNLLKKVDPESAARIHPNNARRVIRALEIFYSTGKSMSEHLKEQEEQERYNAAIIGLTMERAVLYKRIDDRVDQMLAEGLVEEVKRLYDQGIRDVQSIQAIGYKELYKYFDGNVSLEEAVATLKKNTRRYAKRQFTWFRNKMDVKWFDMTPPVSLEEKVNEIFHYVAGKLLLEKKY